MFNAASASAEFCRLGQIDPADYGMRVVYCIQAGLLPKQRPGPKGRNVRPQIEAPHAVVLLLLALDRGPQVHAPDAVRELAGLPYRSRFHGPGSCEEGSGTLFDACLSAVEAAGAALAAQEDTPAQAVAQALPLLSIAAQMQGGVSVQFPAYTDVYRVGRARGGPADESPTAILASVAIPAGLVVELARIVLRNRQEARRLGVSIDTDTVLAALGVTAGADTPPAPPSPDPPGGQRDAAASPISEPVPGNETAASPGREAAGLIDQPATTELDGPSHPHPTDEREIFQSSFESRAGRSHPEVIRKHQPHSKGAPLHEPKPRTSGALRAAA